MSVTAFEQGRLAYKTNLPMSACEYLPGSDFRTQWLAGWTASFRNDERAAHPEPTTPLMADVARSRMRASSVPRQG